MAGKFVVTLGAGLVLHMIGAKTKAHYDGETQPSDIGVPLAALNLSTFTTASTTAAPYLGSAPVFINPNTDDAIEIVAPDRKLSATARST